MRRHDDLLRADRPAVGNGARPLQPAHGRVLVGPQPSGRGRGKAQRVELGLALEPHGSRHRKRQRQLVRKARVEPQLLQRRKLLFQLSPVVQGIDKRILFLEPAVDLPAHAAVARQRRLVGVQVHPRLFRAEAAQQPVVYQPVLGRYLRGGVPGGAGA